MENAVFSWSPTRVLVALGVTFAACGGGGSPTADAGPIDGAHPDSGSDAAMLLDAETDAAGSDTGDAATALDASPLDAAVALGPPYPIVLAHGFFGFEDFAGLDFATYFFEVRQDLAHRGEAPVFTPAVDPFGDSTRRGEQLLAEVEAILAETGHAKVNLIGHSQGGLDARYVAHERPEWVASVTTIATPHRGTPMLDVLLGITRDDRLAALVDELVRLLGAPLYDEVGEETSLFDALRQLSREGAAAFNDRYPNVPTIPYYSIAGRSDRRFAFSQCTPDGPAPAFIERWEGYLDPIDPLLSVSEAIVDGGFGSPYPNDGLVRIEDARWGTFLGCIPADHLDQVGHLLGDSPGFGNGFDHKEFFADLVAWLRGQGL